MMWKRFFETALDFLLDLIFPKHCAVCEKIIFGYTPMPLCYRCEDMSFNIKCVKDDRFTFDEAIAVLKYEGSAKEAMIKYKFNSVKYYYKAYAYLMDRALKDRPYYKDAIICCVPLSYGRDRDYSQTALIAKELARLWKSEYKEDLLYKCREVSPLSKMKLPERRFYIEGAINVNPQYEIYGKDIVITDDIFTSGTTAEECARVLKMHGAHKVYVICACYD